MSAVARPIDTALFAVTGHETVDLPNFCSRTLDLADGGTLHFVQGPANGPPLVLLPGLLDPWHGFAAAANRLSATFEVILVSLRGHAPSSPAPNGRYRVVDYADDVATLMGAHLRLPAFVAGNSLGGLIALWLGSERPELVRGICLEDAPIFVTESPVWDTHWMRAAFVNLAGAIEANTAAGGDTDDLAARISGIPIVRPKLHARWADRLATMAAIHRQFGAEATSTWSLTLEPGWRMYVEKFQRPLTGAFYPQAVVDQISALVSVVDVRAARGAIDGRFNEEFDHARAIARVRCPIQLMEADRLLSGIVPHADFERACRLAPEARHVYAEGAGHLIHVDRPDWFARQLAAFFLDGHPKPQKPSS